jgi:uncharacterized protein YpuA (DUF1002 family)
MKKSKIMIITIIIILVSVISAIYVNKPRSIAKTRETVTSNADLAFAVLGMFMEILITLKRLLMIYIQ